MLRGKKKGGRHSPSVSILSAARKDTSGTILYPAVILHLYLQEKKESSCWVTRLWEGRPNGRGPKNDHQQDRHAAMPRPDHWSVPDSDIPDMRSRAPPTPPPSRCSTTLFLSGQHPVTSQWVAVMYVRYRCTECRYFFTSGSVGRGMSSVCERKNKMSFNSIEMTHYVRKFRFRLKSF